MFKSRLLLSGLLVSITAPAIAATGFFESQSNQGFSKVCFYDVLGEIHSLNLGATDLCPLTHEFDVTPKLKEPSVEAQKTGFFKEEKTQGFSKLCSYDVLGDTYVLTIGSTEICPLTYKF